MLNIPAIHHRAKGALSYAYDLETLHIRLRTARDDANRVTLRLGDPYDWAMGGGGGNLNAEGAMGWVGGENFPMYLECQTELYDYWIVEAKPEFRRARYAFIVEDDDQRILFGEKKVVDLKNNDDELNNLGNFFCFPFLNGIDVFDAPSWVKETIWYQIFPERFANGDDSITPADAVEWGSIDPSYNTFYGGDLQGVIDHLDYLQELGITGIYFCPITEGRSNHKYDTTDYLKVDPAFGTNEVFKLLVEEAHKRDIKIMLDAVFNHIGYYSPQWQDVLENGKKSKYKDWFHIRKFPVMEKELHKFDGKHQMNFDSFAFTPMMPKLNTENPEVIEYLLEVGRYWVREFNIDAWRLDVANEVDHVFWRKFREAIKEVNPDVYILGEIWHDAMPWLEGDQFDGVMNYPMTDAILDYFAKHKMSATEFKHAVNKVIVEYPQNVNEYSFILLDSHDTPRIINQCEGDKRKAYLAYLFQFTQTGAPCIYYGGEIGLDGGSDPLNRKCMVWDEDKHDMNMKKHIQTLIELRKEYKSFSSSDFNWVRTDDENNVVIFKKTFEDEKLMIVINNSGEDIVIDLPSELQDRTVYELYHDKNYVLDTNLKLGAYGFNIYQL
jgi:glycosidase